MALTAATSARSLPSPRRGDGSEQGTGAFVAAHDDFEQILGGGLGKLAHAEVIDDEQGDGGDRFHVLLAGTVERSVSELFEQDVSFAVEHFVALLDSGLADACAKWLLPVPPGPRTAHLHAAR